MSLESANPDLQSQGWPRGAQTGDTLIVEPDHSLGIPCLKVRRWRRSPTVLPTLWWLGTTPALGLDAREPGGAGGDPRSPESRCSAHRRCCPSQENPVLGSGARWPARRRRRRRQRSAGQYRVATMFDSSQYPYNCFNDDADDYPAGSSDEEKRLTRPAYR